MLYVVNIPDDGREPSIYEISESRAENPFFILAETYRKVGRGHKLKASKGIFSFLRGALAALLALDIEEDAMII